MESTFDLAKQGDSTIIILFIVIVVALVFLIPFLKTISAMKHSSREQEYEREDRFIQVIEKNTEVNTALKTLIEADKQKCEVCRQEQSILFRRMFEHQEATNIKLAEISTTLGVGKIRGVIKYDKKENSN